MTQTSRRRNPSAARRVAETALDVALGGTALAADKAVETVDGIVGRTEDAIQKGSREVRENAASMARAARKAIEVQDGRPYEDRTREELYELAADREIAGRSSMRKAELIAALRAER